MLYPVTNEKRIAISLNGLWQFEFVDLNYKAQYKLKQSRLIGVPASFNELFTTKEERDYVGKVCYEKDLIIPQNINHALWRLRIGAAGNRSEVYVDGILIGKHNGGFLPIDLALPIQKDKNTYRLSIVLDTRLDYQTLPVGEIDNDQANPKQTIHYDFSNLIGLHRNVYLYSVPNACIEDITIETKLDGKDAIISYFVKTQGEILNVEVIDPNKDVVGRSSLMNGKIKVLSPELWDIGQGILYQLKVETDNDIYVESFGIRQIEIKANQLLLNHKPVYLKGFGMHEDHVTIGKGSISALNIRDFSLLKWIHANSFRTSHYPYAEEMYDLADQMGILIINEMPAVGLNFWSGKQVFNEKTVNQASREVYKKQFDELIERDKNHPSVIMYSVANEANTHEANALEYFSEIFLHVRSKTKLPLMIVEWVGAAENKVAHLADLIGINRYIGWYVDFGDLSDIETKLKNEFVSYYQKYNRPMILTEFGADTMMGLHQLPSVAFSEEFQVEFVEAYQKVVKQLDFVIGEHVWNFADFQTKQGLTRINGNKKGVFSRDRQPKMVAHFLRKAWEESDQ